MSGFDVKICGLSTPESIDCAVDAGATMVGFVSFPASPRHVGLGLMRSLAAHAGHRVGKVVLTVDADMPLLAALVEAARPDWLQLHGRESPERADEIRARFGLPVMKAFGIAGAADLEDLVAYRGHVDRYLFDAKPPRGATRPGGLGVAFDWRLLAGLDLDRPFMLSGGLTPDNVAEAIAVARPAGVDASSGIETARGVKDEDAIRRFVAAARKAGAGLSNQDPDR